MKQDFVDAVLWYRKAAEVGQGFYKAEFNLGLKYSKGRGIPQNYIHAYKWLHLATRDAINHDWKKAHDWKRYEALRDSAGGKLNPAQIIEAQRLLREYIDAWEDPDFTFDYTEAVKWWRKAADYGNTDALIHLLADAYYYGREVLEDHAGAANLYLQAVAQGDAVDADAQDKLGAAYYSGSGLQQNHTEAARWFRKSADQGCPSAQFNIGRAYAIMAKACRRTSRKLRAGSRKLPTTTD